MAIKYQDQSPMSATATPVEKAEGPVHLVAYFECAAGDVAATLAQLRRRRAAALRARAVSWALFGEIARPNRLVAEVVVAAADAEAARQRLAADIDGLLIAPPDVRPHRRWLASLAAVDAGPAAVHVFTHVDVPPPRLAALQALLTPFVEASRREAGVLRFDLLQSTERPNHQTLVEAWENEEARRAHETAAAARAFRAGLGPLLGALYDDRLCQAAP